MHDRAVAEESTESLKTAVLQLERAEDYLEAVASLLPELGGEIERMVDDVEGLKQELTRRRLAR
jgi:hypothetical protein